MCDGLSYKSIFKFLIQSPSLLLLASWVESAISHKTETHPAVLGKACMEMKTVGPARQDLAKSVLWSVRNVGNYFCVMPE